MTDIEALPYDPAGGDGGPRPTTQLIVIHATDNTAPATAEALYAEHRPDHTSAHFYVDDQKVIRALPLGDIAYGCYPIGNSRSVQFELTGQPTPSMATQLRAAPVVAEVARRYNIPLVHLTPDQAAAGYRGIIGHDGVTMAWHQGDHMDPGSAFPWAPFIAYVAAAGAVDPMPEHGTPPQIVADPPYPGRLLLLRNPMIYGHDVRTWQSRMSVRGWRITVDGYYGPQSANVARQFQQELRNRPGGMYAAMAVDGIVGPQTWAASWAAPIT